LAVLYLGASSTRARLEFRQLQMIAQLTLTFIPGVKEEYRKDIELVWGFRSGDAYNPNPLTSQMYARVALVVQRTHPPNRERTFSQGAKNVLPLGDRIHKCSNVENLSENLNISRCCRF